MDSGFLKWNLFISTISNASVRLTSILGFVFNLVINYLEYINKHFRVGVHKYDQGNPKSTTGSLRRDFALQWQVCVCVCTGVCVQVCVCVCVYSVDQSCPTLCDSVDCSPPGSSVRGISHARILEWVAISSCRVSSQPRDQTHLFCVSCIAGGFFTTEPQGAYLRSTTRKWCYDGWMLVSESSNHYDDYPAPFYFL